MAIGATIYRVHLNIADMDRHYYEEHTLTMAKHPSETDLRLMVRLIAFVRHANEALEFTKGISQEDEPDLWQKSLSDDIDLWIDIGQPDEKRVKKACGRSKEVFIYIYQEGPGSAWFKLLEKKFKRFSNLRIVYLKIEGEIEALVSRSMDLQCNISDGEIDLIKDDNSVHVNCIDWK